MRKFLRTHFVDVILETPFEVLISLYSIYAGIVGLVWKIRNPFIDPFLGKIVCTLVAVGGVAILVTRFNRRSWIRYERAGLALMVVPYLLFGSAYLYAAGVTFLTLDAVLADFVVAMGLMIRIYTLGVALRSTSLLQRRIQ